MSQWTHFIGAIRYESLAMNVWPEPPYKDKIVNDQIRHVDHCFRSSELPTGSEGPIGFNVVLTSRGPTVLITGDLRDFGYDDLQSVIDWLNSVDPIQKDDFYGIFMVRDAMIWCDVEYGDKATFITYNHDLDKFVIAHATMSTQDS